MEKTGLKYAENGLKMSRGPLLSKILATCLQDIRAPTVVLLGWEGQVCHTLSAYGGPEYWTVETGQV